MLQQFHDTIAAIATPEGRGALAIVRVSGPDAISVVSRIVSDPQAVWVARAGSAVYARITSQPPPDRRLEKAGEIIDDVVIHVFRAPRSYTGEDLCEITPHGSAVIARQILDLLLIYGARQAEPGEFSRRAFFNGKIGIEEAELISIKAEAQSDRELRGAELALHEKFERLRGAYDSLISLIALVDAEIDFGESDQIEIKDFAERIDTVAESLSKLLRDSVNRRVNAGYYTIALVGPPNVGKSSVFNAMLNFERSIVSETPGTTRDYVEAFIDVDGFRVKLVDTAGVRSTEEVIESRGIALGMDAALHADVSFRLTDPTERFPSLHADEIALHNKIDLDGWCEGLRLSAKTGEGFADLHGWIIGELSNRSSDFSAIRLTESESTTLNGIGTRLRSLDVGMEPAILSEELRLCATGIASILGLNISESSLEHIFSKMCIGK